jgi:predicted dienelactone hydrolase
MAKMMNRIARRVVKTIAVFALIAVAAVTVLLAALAVDHSRSTELPAPSGSSKVGRATYVWTDEARVNPYAPVPGTKQDLAVWIWYPAAPTPSTKTSEYLPAYWSRALERHQGFILSKLLSRDLARIETHSWSNADVSPEQATFPVVILRAGGGALSSDYTTLAEDLASYGYIVVSFDAPYRTVITAFPDGRVATRTAGGDFETMPYATALHLATQVMNVWIADLAFVLDRLQELNASDPTGRFKGKFDLQKLGIVGHSLGGATAAQFCHDDTRCKAGIDIDGMPFGNVIQDGLHQPFLFLMSDHSRESGSEPRTVERNIESIYDHLPEGKRWQMTMIGANHFTFSDQMFTKSPIFMAFLRRLGVLGPLEKRRGLAITGACVHTFFDVYLKGALAGELDSLPALYPELKMGITKAFPQQTASP